MTLSGRKVLITGANRGLGASFVEAGKRHAVPLPRSNVTVMVL